MPDGPGGFAQNYSCSALLRITLGPLALRVRDCHPLRCDFPDSSIPHQDTTTWSYNPAGASPHRRFGLFPGRSPLLGESLSYFLFLGVLRCFSSLRSPHCYSSDNYPSGNWVVPFGNPRVKGHLHLTAAYRSLSRPSSPPGAKASTRRPNSLSPTLTPYSTYSGDAHTFSCFLRFVLFLDLNKVFTYSLVCQYVKDLFPNRR